MSFLYRNAAPFVFRSILWHTNELSIHLTFDDGPHPRATPKVLEILKRRGIRATFFLLGTNVRQYPDLAREVVLQGHIIGNHSLTHSSLFLKSFHWQSRQIQETGTILREQIQVTPKVFRPPFGHFNLETVKAARTHGMQTVLWDIDSKDFSTSDPRIVVRRVCGQSKSGSIILFHDNESTLHNLEKYLNPILDDFEQRNLKCSPLVL